MVVLSSRGEFGFKPGEPRDGWNHLNPHLRTIATQLFGIDELDIHEIASEYQEFGGNQHQASREAALTEAVSLGEQLAAVRELARGNQGMTA
jgi:FMN-dependent NADH-azoreductase